MSSVARFPVQMNASSGCSNWPRRHAVSDAIGDLDLKLQGKLVRALERERFSVGGTQKVEVNLRIVAATNRDLSRMVAADSFATTFCIAQHHSCGAAAVARAQVDIAPLSEHFLEQSWSSPPRLLDDALEVLNEYRWPGNVRELRNVMNARSCCPATAPCGA